jgi:3-(3-hydroxy-phenyl)propionate hydroxylase
MVAEFDLGVLSDVTRYPYRLHLEQHRLTPIQLDILRGHQNAEVHFGHRVTGFEQKADSVVVSFESEGIPTRLEASYLVAADGGRSTVRKLLGVEFEGFTWPEQFLVVSTPHDLSRQGFTMNAYVADPEEWVAVFKMPDAGPPGLWRLAFPCAPGLPDDALLEPRNVQARMQGFLPNGQAYEIKYQSIYRVHQRVASEWRRGRVLLAGDAAHLNNPLGGFGLNSGIHDAVNLADKLAPVWRGEADEALLDRYVRQRRAATIEQVQAMSIRNKRLLEERDPAVQTQRMVDLVATAADPQRSRQYLLESSMIAGLRKSLEIQ